MLFRSWDITWTSPFSPGDLVCESGDCIPKSPGDGIHYYSTFASWKVSPFGGTATIWARWPDQQGWGWTAPSISLTTPAGEEHVATVDPYDYEIRDLILGPVTINYDPTIDCTAFTLSYGPVSCGWSGLGFCYHRIIVKHPDPNVCAGSYHANLRPEPEQFGPPSDNPDVRFDGEEPQKDPVCPGLPRSWVNMSFLNLVVEDSECGYRSFGHLVAMRRVWNMLSDKSGMFGNGWSFAYESTLDAAGTEAGADVSVALGSGQTFAYRVAEQQGEDPLSILHVRVSSGVGPVLIGKVDGTSGAVHYLFEDQVNRLVSRYDPAGTAPSGAMRYRLTSITDRNGNTLALGYDGALLSSLTDASGRRTEFFHDAQGRCSSFRTFDGKTATFSYDSNGNLLRSVDLAGNVSVFEYDGQNAMTSMDAAGKTTRFAYADAPSPVDGSDIRHVSSVTEADGDVRTYSFTDYWGARVTNGDGAVQEFAQSRGRSTMYADAGGGTVNIFYDERFLPVFKRDANGFNTFVGYDGNANPTSLLRPDGLAYFIEYDADQNPVRLVEPSGRAWLSSYDANGNLTGLTSPAGRTTGFTLDGRGLVVQKTMQGGASFTYEYDKHGNPVSVTSPLGRVLGLAYDAFGGNLLTATDSRGLTTSLEHDANNRLTRVTHPDGSSIVLGYDAQSPTSLTNENGRTLLFQRDAMHRLTGYQDPLNRQTNLSYSPAGRLIGMTDARGGTVALTRDAPGRIVGMTNPAGGIVGMGYDANGNLTTVSDENGQTTSMTYDPMNRLVSISDPLGRIRGATRDAEGRVTRLATARGGVVDYEYDEDGFLIAKKYDGQTQATYARNQAGWITGVVDATGTLSVNYDVLGRPISMTYPDGLVLTMTWNLSGKLASMTYPGGLTVAYRYDDRDRISRVSWGGNCAIDMAWDAAGNLLSETRQPGGSSSTYAYAADNRARLVEHRLGNDVLFRQELTRDALGNVTGQELILPPGLAPAIGPESVTAQYDQADQASVLDDSALTHDADGNLVAAENGGFLFNADYDLENRPVSIVNAGVSASIEYNGLGNRVRTVRNGVTRIGHHDHLGRPLFETDEAGSVVACYIYAGERLTAMRAADGTSLYYLANHIGSVVAMTDQRGALSNAYFYGDYGAVEGRMEAVPNPFTFVGTFGVMDDGDGLFFMRNRFYHATLRRFLQKDPIGFAGGVNPYAYAANGPITSIDPDGKSLTALMLGGAVLGALSVGALCWSLNDYVRDFQKQVQDDKNKPKIGWGSRDAPEQSAKAREELGNTLVKFGVKGAKLAQDANATVQPGSELVTVGSEANGDGFLKRFWDWLSGK